MSEDLTSKKMAELKEIIKQRQKDNNRKTKGKAKKKNRKVKKNSETKKKIKMTKEANNKIAEK